MKDKLYKIWQFISYLFVAAVLLWFVVSYRAWLAGYDVKCFLSADPAICSAIKGAKNEF